MLCCIIKKHETSYHLIIRDCPSDNFIMLYQLLKMCSTTGLYHDVSVCCTVQSRCLFQWTAVNHRDCLSCVAAWTWINLMYYRNKNTYSVCPWNTDTEWIGSRKSHRRNVVSRDEVTTRRWVGWEEVCVSSWSWPVWSSTIFAVPTVNCLWIPWTQGLNVATYNSGHAACLQC